MSSRTVLYRSFGPTTNRPYLDALASQLATIADRLGTPVELSGVDGAEFSTKQYRVFHPRDIHRMLADLHAAQSAGIGCVVIGNIQDPGLYEARQACHAPVVGLLESSVLATRPFGASVGLLASAQRVVPLLRERLRQYQTAVSGIEVCGRELASWSQAFTDAGVRSEAIGDVLAAARRSVASGADIIVPASGIVTALLATEFGTDSAWQVAADLPIIINPIYVAVAHGVMAMQLHQAGLTVSRIGTYERPAPDELKGLFG